MAAYAALLSLMNLIHDIQHHPSPPISLDKQLLHSITQHITFFQKFLHAYNPPPDEEAADPLEMRIANAVYAAEDAIESHIVDSIQEMSCNNSAFKITRILNCFRALPKESNNANDENIKSINLCRVRLQSAIREMDLIKKEVAVKVDSETKKKKTLVVNDQVATTTPVSREETMVGSNDVLLEIMEKLVGGESNRQVIPIVGMGGIGKTFLAKSIYAAPIIKEHFDICVWSTNSQNYNTGEIVCEVLSQATDKEREQLSVNKEHDLGSELHKYLFGRRFLIVLDDMWSVDAWDKIQRFFPNNHNGSRVLVTTRLSQLSSQLNNDYNLHMSFLDEASSWDLFTKIVFGDKSSCPHELKEIGEMIVDHCRGLPLSIAVVGGLLKKMAANRASWESIRDNTISVVNMDNNKHCLRLLKMSYNHLPVYLKPCFLYMGVFEEDDVIRVSALVKLWASEGFLKPANFETLETTARGFIQDLIDRNLVLIHKLGSTGSIKSCKIHDLLRDLCLREGQKDGFYHVVGQCTAPLQGMNTHRRIVIPRNTSNRKVGDELRYMSHGRSIICNYDTKILPFQDMRLLRTLQTFPGQNNLKFLVFGHVNLRHITIKTRSMSKFLLSSVLSQQWNLHTLKVQLDFFDDPINMSDFWKMPQLRNIEFVIQSFYLPDPPSNGRDGDSVVIMENLHTLKGVCNFKCSEEVVKRIPNIKKLGLKYYNEDGEYFVENIKSLRRLESLSLYSKGNYVHNKLMFPHSLKKLFLGIYNDDMEWEDMMEKIGSLPLLEKLSLQGGCFAKGQWEVVEGQFSCIKYLKLYRCRGLKNWRAAVEGSNILPRLEHLILYDELSELQKIPAELGDIDTLKRILLFGCGEEAVKFVKEMVDEQVESQGDEQLSFHVQVHLKEKDKHMLRLAGPNIMIKVTLL